MANERTERPVRSEENDYRAERKKRLAKAAKQKSKKNRNSTDMIAALIKVIVCLAVVFAILWGLYIFGVPQKLLPALKVGDRTFTVAEYNYYYSNVYQSYANQASQMQESYGFNLTGFDYTKSPADQTFGEETFDAVFQDRVKSMLEEQCYYIGLAKEAGMELSEEHLTEINTTIETFVTSAQNSKMSPDSYLNAIYGKGVTRSVLRKCLEEQFLAEQYKEEMQSDAASELTDEAINAAYEKDSKLYDSVDIRLFGLSLSASTSEEPASSEEASSEEASSEEASSEEATSEEATSEEATSEEATSEEPASEEPASEEVDVSKLSGQEKLAYEMLERVTDEDSFIKLAEEYAAQADKETFKDPDATRQIGVKYNTIKTNFDEELAEWLFASDRQVGDKRVCKNDNYVFVIMISKTAYREDSPLVSARHILISFEEVAKELSEGEDADTSVKEETASDGTKVTNEGTSYSAAVVLKAYEDAKKVLDEYNNGEKTEDAFAALAEEYSSDTASLKSDSNTVGGGLYSDITKGQMVAPFENWVYDAARKTGDVGIVMTKYGWHVMYFVGAHEEASWKESVRTALATEKQTEAEEAAKSAYEGTAKDSLCIAWAKKTSLSQIEKLISRNYSSN